MITIFDNFSNIWRSALQNSQTCLYNLLRASGIIVWHGFLIFILFFLKLYLKKNLIISQASSIISEVTADKWVCYGPISNTIR